jgi:hypothetical protein
VVAAAAGRLITRVLDAGGPLPGPGLTLLRVDPGRLDPHFVAGALRNSASARAPVMQARSTGRADIRRARIPCPPLAEQRGYGAAFRRMERLERAAQAAAALSEDMSRLLADAVAEGTLEPPDCPAAPPEAR